MGYTTYVEDPKQKPGQFDWLQIYLDRAFRKGKPVYFLVVSREDHMYDADDVVERLKKIPGVDEALPVNGTIGCIATGEREKIEGLAKKIHAETHGEPVGCIEYGAKYKNNMTNFYVKIKEALDTTREHKKPWHIYNPEEDSLQALIDKARLM